MKAIHLVAHLLGPSSLTAASAFSEVTHAPELASLARTAVHCAIGVVVGLVLERQETRRVSAQM